MQKCQVYRKSALKESSGQTCSPFNTWLQGGAIKSQRPASNIEASEGSTWGPTFPGHQEVKRPLGAQNLSSQAPEARESRGGPRAPPSGPRSGLQAGPPHTRRAAPPPRPSPFPSREAQGPTRPLRPQNGCRQLRHVTPLCLSGSRTP